MNKLVEKIEYRDVKPEEIKEVRQIFQSMTGEEIKKSLEEWREQKRGTKIG